MSSWTFSFYFLSFKMLLLGMWWFIMMFLLFIFALITTRAISWRPHRSLVAWITSWWKIMRWWMILIHVRMWLHHRMRVHVRRIIWRRRIVFLIPRMTILVLVSFLDIRILKFNFTCIMPLFFSVISIIFPKIFLILMKLSLMIWSDVFLPFLPPLSLFRRVSFFFLKTFEIWVFVLELIVRRRIRMIWAMFERRVILWLIERLRMWLASCLKLIRTWLSWRIRRNIGF